HVPVGRIESEHFSENGDAVEYQVFVDAPHHERITTASKFWSAGGISVELGVDGISTSIESLESFLSGGVAFDTLLLDAESARPRQVDDDAIFRLHANEKEARNSLYTEGHAGIRFTVVFNESVRGLRPGAPVEMDGIRVGEVLEVLATVSGKPGELFIRSVIELQPKRVGAPEAAASQAASYLDAAFRQGLRAKLESGNILTGALYINLVRVPGARGGIDFEAEPYPMIPSTASDLEALTGSIGQLSSKLAGLPLDQLVGAATRTLNDVHHILNKSDAPVRLSSALRSVDEAAQAFSASTGELPKLINALNRAADTAQSALGTFAAGSELHFEAKAAIRELREAAEAIESLAETVSEKPNALLLGK
ncbi:MAG: MlaD family protein, partial [Myxococcota bacterium]